MPLLDRNPVRCVARRDNNDPSGEQLDLIWLIAPAQTSPDHARRFS
jgi:hypothetical protein